MSQCPFENYFTFKFCFIENLIHQDLNVMCFFVIQMHINTSVLSQQFSQKDQSLPQKLQKSRSGNLVLICLLILTSSKFLPCCKRRINIYQPHPWRPIGVLQFSFLLHLQEDFKHLKVVTKDEHVRPAVDVLTVSEDLDSLQWHGHCISQDVLLSLLVKVDNLIFFFCVKEKRFVIIRQEFALFKIFIYKLKFFSI